MSIYNYIHTEIYSLKSYDVNFLITWIFEPQALSSTNDFSMSILRGSVTVGEIILFIDVSLAWDQGGAALSPSSGHPLGPLLLYDPVFCLFPPLRSLVLGLMTVTLWNLRNYLWITKSQLLVSNTSYQLLQTTKRNFEKLLGQQVFPNHNWNPFQSSSSLSIPAFFRICCIIYTFF